MEERAHVVNFITKHKFALEKFQTITVEVVYKDISVKDTLKLDEDILSDLALKKISTLVEKKFGNGIAFSRFGKPYSFRTNPLNLAIVFKIGRHSSDRNKFDVNAHFERAAYLSVDGLSDDPYLKGRYEKLIKSGIDEVTKSTIEVSLDAMRTQRTLSFFTEDEFAKRIDFLSAVIIEDMDPQKEVAAAAEERLRIDLENSK